jgi:hypothetical protein
MIKELHEKHNVCNFHMSTLNLERSTKLILQNLKLISQDTTVSRGINSIVYLFLFLCRNSSLIRNFSPLLKILIEQRIGMNSLTVAMVTRDLQVRNPPPSFLFITHLFSFSSFWWSHVQCKPKSSNFRSQPQMGLPEKCRQYHRALWKVHPWPTG